MTVNTETGEIVDAGGHLVNTLEELEDTIEQGLHTFVEVGNALATIRDLRMYRDTHESFEAYCRDRWNMSRSVAYDTIAAADAVKALSAIADTPTPANEGQARQLRGLEPELAAEVMQRATSTPEPVTAQSIKTARTRVVADLAAKAVADFPELAHFVDAGDERQAVDVATALRGYDEPELSMRMDNLRKSIAAAKRRAEAPKIDPGPDYVKLADAMFDALNYASSLIARNGGAETFEAAVTQVGRDRSTNWHEALLLLEPKLAQLIEATAPKIRRIK